MAAFNWTIRQWEFISLRVDSADPKVDPEEVEEATVEMMEKDGWEYITTRDERGSTVAGFKKADGENPKKPRFPVWESYGPPSEIDTVSGIDRRAKMTDREKLGKRAKR